MKYCTYCGNEIAEDAVVCLKCGCAASAVQTGSSKAKRDSLSTLSLVGFVFSFLFPLVGMICSVIAYKNAQNEGDERSLGFAKAGIIICTVVFLLAFFACFILIIILSAGAALI